MRIDHIAIYVLDLEKAKTFFCKYFNGTPNEMYHNPKTGLRTYFISFPDGGRIELMSRPHVNHQTFDPYRQGFIHLPSFRTRHIVHDFTVIASALCLQRTDLDPVS